MRHAPRDIVPGPVRAAVDAGGATGATDGELLERFAAGRDEAAFAALLRRHGPMVLGVCRRILHDSHEAEDAFQATFLVLVRKAASIAKRQSVGSWLHGVAYRTAWKAKTRAHRRRACERQAVNRPIPDPVEEILWRDLLPVLDEEVHRLPEKYRAPVVLCYLEGRTYAEAARQMGCSKGTVANRLAEARERLRDRLTRRDVAVPLALFPTLLAPPRTVVPVPEPLGEATVKVASLWAAGGAAARAVPASVATLAEAVLSALTWAKLKLAAAVLLAAGVLGGGAGFALHRTLADDPTGAGNGSAGPSKGRKTLPDRLDGLPAPMPGVK